MTDQLDKFSTPYLHQRLDYNAVTGVLTWNPKPVLTREEKRWNTCRAGKVAGTPDKDGYITIMLDGKKLRAHRLAWKMTFGEAPPPEMEVDHIDRVKNHNSISNLRLATDSQSAHNRNISFDNTSGCQGVCYISIMGKWQAYIMLKGRSNHLGYFIHKEDAIAARHKAELELFGEFSPLVLLK